MTLVEANWKIVHLLAISTNGNNTSKKELFSQLVLAVAFFKGYVEFVIYKYLRMSDIILWLKSVVLDHMQERRTAVVIGKST